MTIKLHTYDIQKTVIALIQAKIYNKAPSVITDDDYDRLSDLFNSLNDYCTADNDYTLTIDIH